MSNFVFAVATFHTLAAAVMFGACVFMVVQVVQSRRSR
jgi:hypothetical protein